MSAKATPSKLKGPGHPANTKADVQKGSEAVKNGWQSELDGRILQFPGTAEEFIDDLLPRADKFKFPEVKRAKAKKKLDAIFDEYKPKKGKELREYPHLVSGYFDICHLCIMLTGCVAQGPERSRCDFSEVQAARNGRYPREAVRFPVRCVQAEPPPDFPRHHCIVSWEDHRL